MIKTTKHIGDLVVSNNNLDYCRALKEVSGSVYISADNASLPLLEKSGYVDVKKHVNIRGLTGIYTIRGQSLDLRYVDSFTMIIDSEVQRGDFTISKARYFGGGDLDKLKRCFLAKRGDIYAHGTTAKEAVSDVNFKFLQQDFDATKLVAEINERKTVSIVDYRLLTGACLAGVHNFLASKNIDFQEQEVLPLSEVLSITKGAFGADRMAKLFNHG